MYDDMGFDSSNLPSSMGSYAPGNLNLSGMPKKPGQPSFLNAFRAGVQQNPYSQSPVMAGLGGALQGRGGFLGAIGNIAHFLT